MEKQQLPEPLAATTTKHSILGTLATLAFRSGFLHGKIAGNFPTEGKPWRLEGRSIFPALLDAVAEVFDAFMQVKLVLNPDGLTFDDPARLAFYFGTRDSPSLPDRCRKSTDVATANVSSEQAVAANDLIDLFGDLVRHYQWERVVCLPHDWDSCTWSFVDPPPIPIKMLMDFKDAASRLGHSLNLKDAKLRVAEMLEIDDRRRSQPTEATTTAKNRTRKIDGIEAEEVGETGRGDAQNNGDPDDSTKTGKIHKRYISDTSLFPRGEGTLATEVVNAAKLLAIKLAEGKGKMESLREIMGSKQEAKKMADRLYRPIKDERIALPMGKHGQRTKIQ